MPEIFYSTVYICVFLFAFASLAVALYHGARTIGGIREDRGMLANFVAPLVLVLPGMLTDEGKHHRKRFAAFMIAAGVATMCLYFMELAFGKPPYMH